MARTIVITSKHDLGIDGAKRRISDRFEMLKTSYMDRVGAADLTWDGNVGRAWATSLGQKGSAVIEIEENALKIEITLPWLLAPMAGLLESIIKGNSDALAPGTPTPISVPDLIEHRSDRDVLSVDRHAAGSSGLAPSA